MRLEGKHVIVVGASSGMGLAVARLAGEEGARVTLASRSIEKLEQVRSSFSGQTDAQQVDMLDEESVEKMYKAVGSFDHLIVTAVADEVKLHSSFASMSTDIARKSLDKLWGAFFLCRGAASRISANGSITLTSSIAAVSPPRSGGYAMMNAASAAVAALTRSLAAELKPIRVNAVMPGVVNTGVWAGMSETEAQEFKTSMAKRLPVGHLGEPAELAEAFLFCMTNTYTTGTLLVVDGGALLS